MSGVSESFVSLPFEVKPCQCLKVHAPQPKITQQHHIWPQSDQKKKHGKVIDHTTVSLCGTAHDSVHAAISAWVKNKPFTLENRYQRAIANKGYQKIMEQA